MIRFIIKTLQTPPSNITLEDIILFTIINKKANHLIDHIKEEDMFGIRVKDHRRFMNYQLTLKHS